MDLEDRRRTRTRSLTAMKQKKLYVVRKYIMATNAREAISLERTHAVDEAYVDDDWKKANPPEEPAKPPMGYNPKQS